MKITHRIGISASQGAQSELASLGLEVTISGLVIAFDIDEADPRWDAVEKWVKDRGASDIVQTKFTRAELQKADYLEVVPDWHHGYPQPEQGNGYLAATYDLSEYCELCGVGLRQIAPFRMKAEPKWGRRGILQLNWVFDEFFVTPQVWDEVFAPSKVSKMPVLNRHGSELRTVVQLVCDEYVDVLVAGLDVEICERCGRSKHAPVVRGMFPSLADLPVGAMAKTVQWFGSGASAHHRVIASQDLRSRFDAARVRGASFRPVSS